MVVGATTFEKCDVSGQRADFPTPQETFRGSRSWDVSGVRSVGAGEPGYRRRHETG
jgi:hypothetical protein